MPDLTILFPSPVHDNPQRPVPATFAALGRVKHTIRGSKIRAVRASVQLYTEGGKGALDPRIVAAARARRLRPTVGLPNPGSYDSLEWTVMLKVPTGTTARALLTVGAYELADAIDPVERVEVNLWLKRPLGLDVPSIDWPYENGYTVEGEELTTFLTFGMSDCPLTRLDITTVDTPVDTMNPTDSDWDEGENSWWATFEPGALPGYPNRVINVDNVQGEGPSRSIVVDN